MTYDAVLTEVHKQIGDPVAPYRWDDSTLKLYIDDGVVAIAQRAPWLRLTTGGALVSLTITDMPTDKKEALVAYTAYRALSEDRADASQDGRAAAFKAQWEGAVL